MLTPRRRPPYLMFSVAQLKISMNETGLEDAPPVVLATAPLLLDLLPVASPSWSAESRMSPHRIVPGSTVMVGVAAWHDELPRLRSMIEDHRHDRR